MSELRTDTSTASDGTSPVTLTKQQALKNYCYFDADTSVSILDSFNTASVSDTAAGRQSINLTNAHSSANYGNFWSGEQQANASGCSGFGDDTALTKTSSKYNGLNQRSGGADFDLDIVNGCTVGDLA